MKKFFTVFALGFLLSVPAVKAGAGEIDVLLERLVQKGVLTSAEAQAVRTETKADVERQISDGRMDTLPAWIQKIKLSGDFRARYEWKEKESGTSAKAANQQRGRIRFRLNAEAQVNDQVKVKAGLVTGSADPRSGNQTLTNSFETKDIRLNYAYVQYAPESWITLIGGKFNNPLWTTSAMLWSAEITPEGVGMKLTPDLVDGVDTFLNAGFFILDEDAGYQADPVMWAVQPGIKVELADNIHLKTTVNYYGTNGVQGKALNYSAATNTLVNSALRYKYDAYGATAELGIKDPFDSDYIPYVGVYGDYVQNPDPDDHNEGWLVGAKIGHAKVKAPGNWQLSYNYRELEKDAWLDILPDVSYYSGSTGIKGHQLTGQYGILKNVSLTLNYNRVENLLGVERKEDLFQADLSFKF